MLWSITVLFVLWLLAVVVGLTWAPFFLIMMAGPILMKSANIRV